MLALIIFILLLYMYNQQQIEIKNNKHEITYKDILKPSLKNVYENNKEFTEISKDSNNLISLFLLKIQMYYYYNPQAYEEMQEELENFLVLYRSIQISPSYGGKYYTLMKDKKRLILNNLRSIGLKLPHEYNLEDSLNELENILDSYLDKSYYTTVDINSKDMSYNQFDEDIGSFSYY